MFLVLIDTSAYEDLRLSFNGPVFTSLIELSDQNKIALIGSDILNREIETHLHNSVVNSVNRLTKVAGDLDRLTKGDLGEVSRMLADQKSLKERVFEERRKRFYDFLDIVNYEEIDLSEANIKDVFDDYFQIRPPFGEGKKKFEFPDAFVLNAFINIYAAQLESMCVVSQDTDWEKYFEKYPQVKVFKKISDLIDFVHTNYEAELTKALRNVLGKKLNDITSAIKDAVRDELFELDGDWLDPEVELDAQSLSVEVLDLNVLSITPNSAQIDANVKFSFSLDVWDDDHESAYKDSDTREWLYFGRNQYHVEVTRELPVTVELIFDPHPDDIFDTFAIESVKLPNELYYVSSDDFDFELVQHWNEE